LSAVHRRLWAVLLVSGGALAAEPSAPAAPPPAVILRGQPLPKGTPVTVEVALRQAKDGQRVLVEGTVRRACSHRGCWMELGSSGTAGLRVTFQDYGFFVPIDSAGARARVAGAVTVSTLSREEAEHLAGEGAALERAADGTAREVRVVATGVELRR
jgi:hypothetical protein